MIGVGLGRERIDGAGLLDDAAHEVAADAPGELQRALEVHEVAGLEVAEVAAAVRLPA